MTQYFIEEYLTDDGQDYYRVWTKADAPRSMKEHCVSSHKSQWAAEEAVKRYQQFDAKIESNGGAS